MNPVEIIVSEHDTTVLPTEVRLPTFPMEGRIQNSLDGSTIKPEIPSFAPFIPNVLPETTSAVTDDEPLMAVAEESTVDPAEDAGGSMIPDVLEATTQQEDEEESELEEVPPTESGDGGEAEPEEHVTDGKAHSSGCCDVKQDVGVESGNAKAQLINQTLDCGVESI